MCGERGTRSTPHCYGRTREVVLAQCVCVCVTIQCRKFNKTIEILQGDIESLETDKCSLEKKVELHSKRGVLSDITVAGRRTLGGKGSPYHSPFSSPSVSRREESGGVGGSVRSGGGEGVTLNNTLQTPLLLSRVSVCVLTAIPHVYSLTYLVCTH